MLIPAPERLITLTTDFGTRDGYAGAMKGVIRHTAPEAWVEDLTHDIPPGDIRAGAWALRTAVPFYPRGSVHVVVIDPGVGTPRHAILVYVDGRFLIGPDNGVFSWLLAEAQDVRAWHLADTSWRLTTPSNTFHGRDLFSHAAALIVQEGDVQRVCGEDVDPMIAPWALIHPVPEDLVGEIVHIDHFGNMITNLRLPEDAGRDQWDIHLPRQDLTLSQLHRTYGDVPEGQVLALVGSHQFPEIAVSLGSAAQKLGADKGDVVRVVRTVGPAARE